MTEKDYPYCSGLEKACFPCGPPGYNATRCGPAIPYCLLADSCQAKLKPESFVENLRVVDWKQTSENETDIALQMMKIGPMSVALDATMLQFYHKGIFDPTPIEPDKTLFEHQDWSYSTCGYESLKEELPSDMPVPHSQLMTMRVFVAKKSDFFRPLDK